MKFSINREFRKMLKLFAEYAVLRRMFYAVLGVAVYWRPPEILSALK
ncbi:hypothetical protein MYC81_001749 [Neisseria gonorrhoeae]|uniref:Phage associated protein n=2 Tax=Neisseria gonorrhoeae TaxID=485 RepID=A0AB74ESR7_NEIGO|nr:hypothetical protein [Neisseria gonorrhoeae]MBT8012296.1 hypothetical protein [Neisseria gonorrhoeae]MBT8031320.1 hypothetical protein [Neisseria gonorrhoeae]MCF2974833.1 hypothetical protein [Neisseria gonorrhoeae]MCF3007611.1 hypothetical protein [Neisseria gonorrhoeae]MCF3016566.1 hypothetical protein [Neisseria gonorrhoeae]